MRRISCLLLALSIAACDRGTPPVQLEPAEDPAAPGAAPQERWPEPGAGPIDVRRERGADLTGDGRAERVSATAQGAAYDLLDIALVIERSDGDTLWVERWDSRYYFKYDPLEGKSDAEVAVIVQGHVDALLADDRFHRGMPPAMAGGDPTEMIHESVRYHLAELELRRRAGLTPSDSLPLDARPEPDDIDMARVRAVAAELAARPTYNYFAGGEASYVIGWSEREQAFVRLFACC